VSAESIPVPMGEGHHNIERRKEQSTVKERVAVRDSIRLIVPHYLTLLVWITSLRTTTAWWQTFTTYTPRSAFLILLPTLLIPWPHSYCLSLALCLQWYNGLITPRLHSSMIKQKIVCCTWLTIGGHWISASNHSRESISSSNIHLSHSRLWFNIYFFFCYTLTF